MPAKSELRIRMRALLRSLSPGVRACASEAVCRRIEQLEVWIRAGSVLFYAACPDELDLTPLIQKAFQQSKLVALPQFDSSTGVYRACVTNDPVHLLKPGRFGIPEPDVRDPAVERKQLDLILVPGLAFDVHGHRLGRGGGYYDRLLRTVTGTKCGVGMDEQLQLRIPIEEHDVLLDCMVTPARWLEFRVDHDGNKWVV